MTATAHRVLPRRRDVVECVDAVVAQLCSAAEQAGVSLVGPAEELIGHIDGDPVMLETAIRSLVENAITARLAAVASP